MSNLKNKIKLTIHGQFFTVGRGEGRAQLKTKHVVVPDYLFGLACAMWQDAFWTQKERAQ